MAYPHHKSVIVCRGFLKIEQPALGPRAKILKGFTASLSCICAQGKPHIVNKGFETEPVVETTTVAGSICAKKFEEIFDKPALELAKHHLTRPMVWLAMAIKYIGIP